MTDALDVSQSSAEDVDNYARQLNHPQLERQIEAADTVANLISREPVPDEALLSQICHHEDALTGLKRIILTADDESRQTACNLLFILSMSEPDRPFEGSCCTAHKENRSIIGSSSGLFESFVAGRLALSPHNPSPLVRRMRVMFQRGGEFAGACLCVCFREHVSSALRVRVHFYNAMGHVN